MPLPLTSVFAELPDPRRETKNKLHLLTDVLTLATCAIIGGAESWDAIATYAESKNSFFRRFLKLPNGVPSADTFERVFAKLQPDAFSQAFGTWMAAACQSTGLVPIAIDGKSARRAKKNTATGCLHVVSAWATENRVTLGQVAVAEGSNEIAAIPELLKILDLSGAIVTIDAAGCQVANVQEIRRQGGHYLLPVKDNQPTLHAAVRSVFERAVATDFAAVRTDGHTWLDDGHGRSEERTVSVIYDPVGLPPNWTDVAAVVMVGRGRKVGDASSYTTQYYITSHAGTAQELGTRIRAHWGIENSLHWVLDVVFREDDSRVRAGHAGENLALMRRVAVSLLRRAPGKESGRTKRMRAGWDDDYLLKVLLGFAEVEVR
jgi:predicted transposase YbfD/YdcC